MCEKSYLLPSGPNVVWAVMQMTTLVGGHANYVRSLVGDCCSTVQYSQYSTAQYSTVRMSPLVFSRCLLMLFCFPGRRV
jgi:hypothetical protein